LTARAPDQTVACKAAVFFFGRMLDALTLAMNRPMYLSLTVRERIRTEQHDVRRVVEPGGAAAVLSELRQPAPGLWRAGSGGTGPTAVVAVSDSS
jgi:hypothetical protein